MDKPKFYITKENFLSLIGPGFWSIQDLPNERAEQVRPFLAGDDTLGVFASGSPPQAMLGMESVVGGIDWVRLESHRKCQEPPINVYHFVIKCADQHGHPVYACKEGKSIAPHWSEWSDLDGYMQ
jgi:hypothetical protein